MNKPCWQLGLAVILTAGAGFLTTAATAPSGFRDTRSDTWVGVDALGRVLPGAAEVGPPRPDRQVGIFYFLWLGPHAQSGPHDITRILAEDPEAMRKPDSPLWGPLHAPHHWGESVFGYYNSDDPFVLRKHAQMLSDAGVDVVIFDVTNQRTYRTNYLALMETFEQVRRDGGRTPQVAFLCPFWRPQRVVAELYRELYQPGLHRDLWYRWEGKPLLLADPDRLLREEVFAPKDDPVRLLPGHTLSQSLTVTTPADAIGLCSPTWRTTNAAATLTLRRESAEGPMVAQRRFTNITDNAWLMLPLDPPAAPGPYHLQMSNPAGTVGWWSVRREAYTGGGAFADGRFVPGDRSLRLLHATRQAKELWDFFTFRKPQPDYFQGPTGPNMWSWLEVFPQHVFTNTAGVKEQMSVGVAQNAVNGRLGAMSEAGARGRSFHAGATDRAPGAVLRGLNFAEQFERALSVDPRFIFITGWNEWIAGRFDEFNGVREPVMFVDEFDQEHSRDIEPMKGGHGDNYYYQMVSFIRRFKGVRPPPPAGPPRSIRLDGDFAQWHDVQPAYRDDRGDVIHRDFPGYNHCRQYTNTTGRNDLLLARVARDTESLFFYVQTAAPLTPPEGDRWMVLLIDADNDLRTGWLGCEFIVNRRRDEAGRPWLEREVRAGKWKPVAPVPARWAGAELHLRIPRRLLGLEASERPLVLNFKWLDNAPPGGDPLRLITDGDSTPNGRFLHPYRVLP